MEFVLRGRIVAEALQWLGRKLCNSLNQFSTYHLGEGLEGPNKTEEEFLPLVDLTLLVLLLLEVDGPREIHMEEA